MFDKLEDLLIRFEEIMGELHEPTVTNNQERFRKLMKEQSDLTPIVDAYTEYKKCKQDIEDSLTDRKVYRHGDLVVDFTGRSVMIKDHRLDLTPKEYDLLFYLVENRNIALSRDQLITNVWGYDYYGDDRTLDTHIKRLRSSLEEYRSCIVTLRGVGYRFDDHI